MNENEFVVPLYLIMENYQLYRTPVLLVRHKVSFTEPIMLVGNSSKSRRDVRLIQLDLAMVYVVLIWNAQTKNDIVRKTSS